MNAISKKLLSMLVAIAMVLSMVPFGGLSIFAVETNATEAEVAETVTPGQANLPEGIQEIIDEAAKVVNTDEAFEAHRTAGTCPMCGATGIEWTPKTAGTSLSGTQNQAVHVYYDSAVSISGNVLGMYASGTNASENNTICVALKSTAVISNTGTRFLMASGTNNVFNIMGSGSVTTNVGTGSDFGMFQLGSGTVNLYGGTYVLEDADGTYAAVRANGGNLNIYNDATIGPETVDTTKPLYNVTFSSASSVVNMYGGTIRNGVTAKNGLSGNVTVARGTFNMYGGTISGGQYLAGTDADGNTISSPASVGGNVIVGGLAEGTTAATSGKFYMYGGTITGGKAFNGGNGGGNINCYNTDAKNVMELMGGVISDGYAKAAGGNVQIQGGTAHKIGGTVLITNGSAASGGNVQVAASRKLTMEGGYITGGALATSSKNATNGGAVYVAGTFEMTGGEIDGCTVSGNGGNIYAVGGATVNVGANATIKNGLSKSAANGGGGGNVYLTASTTAGATMTTSGVITGGTVNGGSEDSLSSGGNISVVANGANQSVLTVNGGEISNGTLTYAAAAKGSAFGGNIRAYNCKVVINDGLIYGGKANGKSNSNIGVLGGTSSSANTNCTLEINGGVILGDVLAGSNTAADGTVTGNYTYTCDLSVSGDAKIVNNYVINGKTVWATYGGLSFYDKALWDVSGLTEGADVRFTTSLGKVISTAMDADTAAAVKPYVSCTNSAYTVDVNDSGALYVIEVPVNDPEVGVFEPWNCGDMAYCQACIDLGVSEEDALVEWTAYTGQHGDTVLSDSNVTSHYHFYLTGDLSYTTKYALTTYENICFNLNGYNVTPNTEATNVPTFSCTQRLNLFNTGAEATVLGNSLQSGGAGCVTNVNGGGASGTFNLFDNVILKSNATSDNSPILGIGGNGGKINIYGGTIDARELTATAYVPAIMLHGSDNPNITTDGKAELNMYGGTIYGGTATNNGGAIRIGSNSNESATTTYINVATFNMYGGEIIGGTAANGGIFYVHGNTLNIYGGTIRGGEATSSVEGANPNGGTFLIESKTNTDGERVPGTLNMSGGTVYGGTAANQGGVMRAFFSDVNMTGGTIYAGTANGAAKTHGVWLVDSDMTMSGDAKVYGPEGATTSANAIAVGQWQKGSSLTMSGNATVKAAEGDSRNCIQITYNATYPNILMISNDWAGEAYFTTTKADGTGYQRGETIDNATAVCGSLVEGVPTKGGSFEGKLYYGPQSNTQVLGVDGDLILGLAAIVAADGYSWYLNTEDAFAAYYANGGFEAGSYVYLGEDSEITLAGDAYVDSRGWAVTVDGVGTLYAMDNANDDYVGFGTWTIVSADVEVAVDFENVVKDRRYVVIDMTANDEGNRRVTAHRLEMGITAVSLRTSQAGLYYKASYSCDTTLASRISAYGVVLSVYDMPGADFLDDPTDGFSCYESGFSVNAANGYTVSATSGAVFGIFKSANRTADENAEYGRMPIYANTYIMVNTQNDSNANNDVALVGDNENAGTQGGVAYSLFDILKAIDTNWADYADAQAQVTEFYNTWAALGMDQYADEFENIA